MSPLFDNRAPQLSYFDNLNLVPSPASVLTASTIPYNTLILQPLSPLNELFPGEMTANTVMLNFTFATTSTATMSSSHSSSIHLGLYSFANATQLTLLNSVNTSWAHAASTNNSTKYIGPRWITIHSSQWSTVPTFTQGRYFWGLICRSSNHSWNGSIYGQHLLASTQRSGTVGSSAAGTEQKWFPFMGIHQTSQTIMPVSIAHSHINAATSWAGFNPHIVFNNLSGSL